MGEGEGGKIWETSTETCIWFNLIFYHASLKDKDILWPETIITLSKRMTLHNAICYAPGVCTYLQSTCSVPDCPPALHLGEPPPFRGQALGGERAAGPSNLLTLGADAGRGTKQTSENPPQPGDNIKWEFLSRETEDKSWGLFPKDGHGTSHTMASSTVQPWHFPKQEMEANSLPLNLGGGLPCCVRACWVTSVVSDSLWPHGL